MTDQHPITPPPELVEQWVDSWYSAKVKHDELIGFIATQSVRWGADQELEACCHLLRLQGFDVVDDLRASRRPKPPSLKEQALGALGRFAANAHTQASQMTEDFDLLRRAVEQLDD